MDGRFVADGEFVVAGGHGPVLFELVDAAFLRLAPFRIDTDREPDQGEVTWLSADSLLDKE